MTNVERMPNPDKQNVINNMGLSDFIPQELVNRCQTVMAHAWMVRTFIKHSDEVDDFPELMGIVRAVFDTARALETREGDPAGYFHLLGKKLGKLRKAAEQFRIDAESASTHTNFKQAVISMNACVKELESLQKAGGEFLAELSSS
jgi:hypothetical protein